MYNELKTIFEKPELFSAYTAADLWADDHTSAKMLGFHLNGDMDVSSRRRESIEKAVEWLSETFALRAGKAVADFGCGPGLYASRLAQTGAAVTGIDFSPRSIAYAKEQAAREGTAVEYVLGNYLEFASDKRFDLIVMIMCDFCALSFEQRRKLLGIFHRHLKPGGRVVLDAYSLKAFADREEGSVCAPDLLDGFWSAQPYFGFANTFKYEENVVLDKYTIVEADRTRIVYNWLQYFSPEALETEVGESGFAVEARLGAVTGSAYKEGASEFAVVLKTF